MCEPHTLFVNIDTAEVKVTQDGKRELFLENGQENALCTSLGGKMERLQGPRPAPPERPHKKLRGGLVFLMKSKDEAEAEED